CIGRAVAKLEPVAKEGTPPAGLRLGTFVADITPPLGEVLCFGLVSPARAIEHPLLAKGIVLRDSGGTYVLCAVDWVELHSESHDLVRQKLAAAVGTTASRVAVQTLHQHSAPGIDTTAQRILDTIPGAPGLFSAGYFDSSVDKMADAARQALAKLQPA